MRSILFNLQVLHFKHLFKKGQNSLRCFSVKCSSKSSYACGILRDCQRDWDCHGPKSLVLRNVRPLSTSVKKFEKLTRFNTDESRMSIIYNGSLTHRVKGIKVFTCMTSIAGIIVQPWILQKIFDGKDVPLGVAVLSCVGFFTFVTPFLCHLITKKYVTEIWYDSGNDTYTATLLSFFLRRISINFKIEDITVPSVPPVFSTMYIKGKPVFIIVDSFLEVEHYIRMMGYDKPMDKNLNAVTKKLEEVKYNEKSKVM